MLDAIAKPFGILMMWLYELTNNYFLAIMLFSLVVKLILLPFQMKSKKGMLKQQLLAPQQAELQKKHGSNQQKYQQELSKLYKEEGVNPMSGCLWSLLPFPILIALYSAIRKPLTVMMGVATEQLAEGGTLLGKLTELGHTYAANNGYAEIDAAKFIHEHWNQFSTLGVDKLKDMSYRALGLDLGAVPSWRVWEWDWSDASVWGPMLGLMFIPLIATFLTWLPQKINKKLTAETMTAAGLDPNASPQAGGKGMMLFMNAMTLFFCFIMPGALGVYWIANSLFGMIQDILLTKHYNKTVAVENAERLKARREREEALERKRQETERRRAENATAENASTSKRKQQNKKKQAQAEKDLAWQRAHSDDEPEYEPSRVGNRRYARGRAYDPDRFAKNGVEGATESTSSLDEGISEEVEERLELAAHPAEAAPEEPAESAPEEPAEDAPEESGEDNKD